MAEERPRIDVAAHLKEAHGLELLSQGSQGGFIVRGPNPDTGEIEEAEIDVRELLNEDLKDHGSNITKVKPVFSTPERPLVEANALSFVDQMNYHQITKRTDKAKFLQDRFGKDNVKFNKDIGDFVAKDDSGQWKQANSGFLGSIVGEKEAIAGGILGAELGAKAGAAILGAPTLGAGALPGAGIGAVLGGALGATVGKLTSIKNAQRVGLRTEADGEELAAELGKEFIVSLAGGAATPLLGAGMRAGTKMLATPFKALGKGASPDAQRAIAKVMNGLNGTPEDDIVMAMNKYDTMKKDWEKLGKWDLARQAAKKAGKEAPPNPLDAEMLSETQKAFDIVEKHISNSFNDFFADPMVKGTINRSRVKLQDVFGVEDVGEFFNTMVKDSRTAADERMWKEMQKQTEKRLGTTKAGEVPWKMARELRQSLDAVAKNRGIFQTSGDASAKAASFLQTMRRNLHSTLNARNPEVARRFMEMNQKFASKRAILDEGKLAKFTDPRTGKSTFKKMFKGEGDEFLDRKFREFISDVPGVAPEKIMSRIAELNAAQNTSKWLRPGLGGVERLVQISAAPIFSPRMSTALSARTFQTLRAAGRMNEWLARLNSAQRKVLLANPELITELGLTISQAPQIQQNVTDKLLGGGQ